MAAATRATPPAVSHPEPFVAHKTSTRTSMSTSSADNRNLLRPNKIDNHTPELSPKSVQARLSPGGAAALTGAAAMAEIKRRKQQQQQQQNVDPEERQTSPNPQVAAMHSLMGTGGMSKPRDAPAPNKMSEPLRRVAEKISVPNHAHVENEDEVSPVSLGSFGTVESSGTGAALTATAHEHHNSGSGHFVAEPADMDEGGAQHDNNNANLTVPSQDANKNISFSYPGPPPQQADQAPEGGQPTRGMSLPGYGQNNSPKSPASTKRHKCPYCSTDFTRHHNLKSHLLTHSQEKPYVCGSCQARFRRLHDLKRHTKLHTGERPHTCDKCGRKFARGDALARHNKGPGGCAGRRSSFGENEDFLDQLDHEAMDIDEDGEGSDEQGRRTSEPNRKRQHLETPQDPSRQVYRQHSSTYPPAPTAAMRGSMGPPQVIHPGSNSATSPRDMSSQASPAGGSYYGSGQVFAEPGMMTQSPKPLSPGQAPDQQRLSVGEQGGLGRNRSTSLTTQFQQQHFGRQSTGRTPPPPPNAQFVPNQGQPHTILPPIGAGNQSQSRGTMQNSMTGPQAPTNMHGHGQHSTSGNQGSNPGSLSSHGRSSGSSMRDLAQDPNDIWSYVRNLESRFSRMQDEYELRISRLQGEVITLKEQMGQVSSVPSYSGDMRRQQYP